MEFPQIPDRSLWPVGREFRQPRQTRRQAPAREDRTISRTDLQGHATPESCWIQIESTIYDVTEYLAEHKDKHDYDLARWCGKDATPGWLDKDGKAKPHSRKAQNLLVRYRIGNISP